VIHVRLILFDLLGYPKTLTQAPWSPLQ
jgi:hypothetical protein